MTYSTKNYNNTSFLSNSVFVTKKLQGNINAIEGGRKEPKNLYGNCIESILIGYILDYGHSIKGIKEYDDLAEKACSINDREYEFFTEEADDLRCVILDELGF